MKSSIAVLLALLVAASVVAPGCTVAGGVAGAKYARHQNHRIEQEQPKNVDMFSTALPTSASSDEGLVSVPQYTVAGMFAGAALDVLAFYQLNHSFESGDFGFGTSPTSH